MALILFFTLSGSLTNATFESQLCPKINNTVTSLNIDGNPGIYFKLPSCVASSGTSIGYFYMSSILVEDFRFFPTSTTRLNLENSRVAPPSTGAVAGSGLDSSGNIVWTDLFSRFPGITGILLPSVGLQGSLPAQLPSTLWQLVVSGNRLTGTIPATLYGLQSSTNALDIELDASNNQLFGNIPPSLYSTFASTSKVDQAGYFTFDVSNNALTGSIPSALFAPLERWEFIIFDVSVASNQLDGLISALKFPNPVKPETAYVTVNISRNAFNGPITSQFNFSTLTRFILDASDCGLSGALPSTLIPRQWTCTDTDGAFEVYLSRNAFTGDIPSGLLNEYLVGNATTFSLVLALDHNSLSGYIPDLFNKYSSVKERDTMATSISLKTPSVFTFLLNSNHLEGSLPAGIFDNIGLSQLPSVIIDFSDNSLTGPIPETLLANLFTVDNFINADPAIFNVSHNQLTGSPPSACWSSGTAQHDFSSNLFNGTIPASWQDCSFDAIDLSYNPRLTASLPPLVLNSVSSFKARNTPLSGALPSIPSTMRELDLSGTNFDFCGSTPPTDAPTLFCDLTNSSVCSCGASYYMCDLDCAPSQPVTPMGSPITPSSPSPSGCSNDTRPSIQFTCSNGTWSAAVVNTTTLVIPPGAGTVIVTGNVTSKTIVIRGIGSRIEVNGSAINLTAITIELTPQQASEIGETRVLQQLITVSTPSEASSITGLNAVAVNTRVTSGCKKVKAQKSLSNGDRTLGAYLTVDNSGCNRWWIILVSVVASLVLLAAIALAVLSVYYKPCRSKFRPYWTRPRSANA